MRKKYGIRHDAPAMTGRVPRQYPWLCEDRHCDLCVIGGGLTGALCLLSAARTGLSAVLITSEGLGFGDTGHNAGCAEFSAGRTLTGLDRIMSADDALCLFADGFGALDHLQNLCAGLDAEFRNSGVGSGFERRDSLLFTSDPTLLELLENEYLALRRKFPDAAFISGQTAGSVFEADMRAGILTKEGSAVLDHYALTHLCAMEASRLGAEIFERTEALDIQTPRNESGSVIVMTSTHRCVYADRLIFAAGSEGLEAIFRRTKKLCSCTVARRLSSDQTGWAGKCCLRTFGAGPVNCCISRDGLISAVSCRKDGLLPALSKAADRDPEYGRLDRRILSLISQPSSGDPDYQYRYAFSAALDGLPVIGTHRDYKNCFFALPGQGNGAGSAVYSVQAAEAAEAFLTGKNYRISNYFNPERI